MIAAWTRQHDKREAMRVLGGAGVPAGRDLRHDGVDQTMRDFERRGIMQTMEHPTRRPVQDARLAGALRRATLPEVKPAPLLGQHTNEVLGRMAWS